MDFLSRRPWFVSPRRRAYKVQTSSKKEQRFRQENNTTALHTIKKLTEQVQKMVPIFFMFVMLLHEMRIHKTFTTQYLQLRVSTSSPSQISWLWILMQSECCTRPLSITTP